jgi:ABC-2 type transport system permease protein
MLARLFSTYGIDFHQWKALTRTAIRLANRQSSIQFESGSRRGRDMNYSLLLSGFVYLILGLVMTSFVFKIHDMFWSSLILFTVVSFIVGSLMLVEFGTIVVAPEDYHIFSVQPVSSMTYFAAKVTFTLLYILFYTLALGLPSVVTYGLVARLRDGSSTYDPLLMLAALAGLIFVGIGVAMSMILLYATILRYVHFRKLKNVLSYLQLVMSFVVYGSYSLLPSLIENVGSTLPDVKPWWIYILPMSWFSSFFDLAGGKIGPGSVILSLLGLGFFVGVIPLAFSKISLTYAESLSRASAVPEEKKANPSGPHTKRNPLFQRDEDRAIATLIRGQFKYDTRFRLGILAIIPLTILYVLMGLRGGGRFFDPFNPDWPSLGHSVLVYFVIVLFPMTIKEAVTRSESFSASWIFFVTPAEKVRLVIALKKILFTFFIVPYLMVLSLVFFYYFNNVLHVLMHLVVLLLFSYAFLQIYLLFNPQMPFSVPRQTGQRATLLGVVMILGPILMIGVLLIFSFFVYRDPVVYVISVAVLSLTIVLLEKYLLLRVSRRLGRLEFLG